AALGSMAGACGIASETDAKARTQRASPRDGSNRYLGWNCGRFYCRSFNARRATRGNSLRPRSPAGVALRARAGLQDRHLTKVETTLRTKNHPRRPLSARLRHDLRFLLVRRERGNDLLEAR